MSRRALILAVVFLATAAIMAGVTIAAPLSGSKEESAVVAAGHAYDVGNYSSAVNLLQAATAQDPRNAELYWLLTKNYYELQQYGAAVASAERAVALDPQNSVYHEWLGRAYGEKAEHSGWTSAISLAKKTHKEFETAVQLDPKNFPARQALIEFYCSAPGIVGGGEDKARPHIEQLAAMDASEGHYAIGNCRRQKKEFAAADSEFAKALDSSPKSLDLIYDIGDYALRPGQSALLPAVVDAGEKINHADPRGKFYRAVALIIKNEKPTDAERLLQEYLKTAPLRSTYPHPAVAHVWLGRLYENENKLDAAAGEYQSALKLNPNDQSAQERLKRVRKS
jgi:tetratricopeptide (TPR) repeat protein